MNLLIYKIIPLGHTLFRLLPCSQWHKLQGINPIDLSAPRADSHKIIALQTVKKLWGIIPMGLSAPSYKFFEIIFLLLVKNNVWINPTGLGSPRDNS